MAKRKYAGVIDTLPKFQVVEPERRDLVESLKQDILKPPSRDTSHDAKHVEQLLTDLGSTMRSLYNIELSATGGKHWASEFARVYAEIRKILEYQEQWAKTFGLLLETYVALMTEHFEEEGISNLRLATGQLISIYAEPYAQVLDKEAFRLWCMQHGMERSMVLPWQTTNAMVKDLLLQGEAEPPGVTCYAKTKIVLRNE